MSRKVYLFIFFLFIISFSACEKDNVQIKDNYMVHCLMVEGEVPKIKIGRTLATFPEYPFDIVYFDQLNNEKDLEEFSMFIENGTTTFTEFKQNVIEYDENSLIGTPKGNYSMTYWTNSEININPDENYEIKVDIKTQDNTIIETLHATTNIPSRVTLEFTQIVNTVTENSYSDRMDTNLVYNITFTDPQTSQDYYYLLPYVIHSGEEVDINSLNLDSLWMEAWKWEENGPFLRRQYSQSYQLKGMNENDYLELSGYLFNDERFNGLTRNLQFELRKADYIYPGESTSNDYLVIDLMHISEEYYKYYYALKKQNEWHEDNVYTEPVQLYTNIENGLGLFAGASVSRHYLRIVSKPE